MYMKIIITSDQFKRIKGSMDNSGPTLKKDPTAKFLKCQGCKKFFTQTFHKKKKSLPICPWCGKHNMELEEGELDERSRSFAFTKKMRLFSKSEMMANPLRYKKTDLGEIGVYKFSERSNSDVPGKKPYREVMNTHSIIKEFGDFIFLYNVNEQHESQEVAIYVVDRVREEQIGVAEFEMRGEDFFVSLPYVKKEYRDRGIALEIYKIILTFGNLVSGKAQSEQAVGLWKKMYKVLPNKMRFIDDFGKKHDVDLDSNNNIVYGNEKINVHGDRGGYLKLYSGENSNN